MEFMKALEELRLQHPESFFDSYNGEISVVLGSQMFEQHGDEIEYGTLFTAPRGNYDMISSKLWLCIHLADHCLIRIDMKNCLNGASDD